MSMSVQDKFDKLINLLEEFAYPSTLDRIKRMFAETKDLDKILVYIHGCIESKPGHGVEREETTGKSFETEIKEIEKIIKDC